MCCARRMRMPASARSTRAAKRSPGVLLVLTGNDPEIRALGLQRPQMPRKRRDGSPDVRPRRSRCSRGDRVRYVGDPVAFVVAETLNQAKDAAELIEVDYEALPRGREHRRGDRSRARRRSGRIVPTTRLSASKSATRPRSRRRSPPPPTWSGIAW